MGRRDCLTKKNFFFTSSGGQRWAEREMGTTKKNTATLIKSLFLFTFFMNLKMTYISVPIAYDCAQPEAPVNGLVTYGWWTFGQYARISCKDPVNYNFAFFPPPFYKCTDDGTWYPHSGEDVFRYPACSGLCSVLILRKLNN